MCMYMPLHSPCPLWLKQAPMSCTPLIVEALSCRKAARHQRHCAAQVVRQLARANEHRCRTALAIWADHVAHSRALRARLCTAVHRLALLRLRAAFTSWARVAEAKRLCCMHLQGLLQRV